MGKRGKKGKKGNRGGQKGNRRGHRGPDPLPAHAHLDNPEARLTSAGSSAL